MASEGIRMKSWWILPGLILGLIVWAAIIYGVLS